MTDPLLREVDPFTINTELNHSRKIICLRKNCTCLLKECQFLKSLKIWLSMAYTVCHAPIPMTSCRNSTCMTI